MKTGLDDFDRRCLKRAIELGRRGWGRVHPNPMVGAVVGRAGRVLGEGWHEEHGGRHAEVAALEVASRQVAAPEIAAPKRASATAGATLYSSLEPCAHHGKTPPCTEAIARAGIVRVVYWAAEPGAREGGGGEWLRGRGVAVEGPFGTEAAWRAENPFFFHERQEGQRTAGVGGGSAGGVGEAAPGGSPMGRPASGAKRFGRPYLALKLAVSLDGCIAPGGGRNIWLTGREARAEVHRLRAGFDALLVGGRTWEADDPRLTARGPLRPRTSPRAVILDRRGRAHPELRLFRRRTSVESGKSVDPGKSVESGNGPRPIVATAPGRAHALRSRLGDRARVVAVPEVPEGLALAPLLEALAALGVRTVLCEGGGVLAASLLGADLADRLYLFAAPLLIGAGGVPAFPPGTVLGDGWRPRLDPVRFGRDTLVILDRDRSPGPARARTPDPDRTRTRIPERK